MTPNADTRAVHLRAARAEVVVDPSCGGCLTALRDDGVDLIKTSGWGPNSFGLFAMIPWTGRLRDGVLTWRGQRHCLPTHHAAPHAIHGTLTEAAWDVVSAATDAVEMTAPLGDDWPFGGRATQRIELAPDALRLDITVEATGDTDDDEFPCSVGWHPWFPRQLRAIDGSPLGAPVELDFEAGGMLARGPDDMPTGEIVRPIPPGPWDDCFVDLARAPVVRWPGAREVTIESDVPYWVAYTEPPDALCIEPETGPPNGLNTGQCAIVRPGQPLHASMTLRWRHLS